MLARRRLSAALKAVSRGLCRCGTSEASIIDASCDVHYASNTDVSITYLGEGRQTRRPVSWTAVFTSSSAPLSSCQAWTRPNVRQKPLSHVHHFETDLFGLSRELLYAWPR
jgi:hypothetical protein